MKAISEGMGRYAKSAAIGIMVAVTFGCLTDERGLGRRGSVVENELGVGYLFNMDGTPAVDARVSAFPVDYHPAAEKAFKASADSQVFVARTDARGRYAFKGVPRGEYNILGVLDGGYCYRDSIAVDTAFPHLASDTLRDPGSLAGTIALQPNHNPRSATVEVLGTQVYANVDEDGAFLLSGLARGQYRLRVSTTIEGYTNLFKTVVIRTGSSDTLEEPLRPDFIGIPVVHPVSAEYDTLSGTATVRWPKTAFRDLDAYVVFRRLAEISAPEVQVDDTEDTVLTDTLFDGETGGLGRTAYPVEYRVRIRDKSTILGLAYGAAKVRAVPPYLVRTTFKFGLIGFGETTVSIGDTVRIVCTYSNPTRMNRVLRWFADGQTAPIRTTADFSGISQDTLTRVWTGAGRYRIRIEADDDGGATWKDSLFINAVLDPPRADAGLDAKAIILDTFRLRGSASQSFGRIVKWEWDVGNTGNFVSSPTGEYLATMPAVSDSDFLCVLRVTDDDGQKGSDIVKLRLGPWKTLPSEATRELRSPRAAADGLIYGIHSYTQVGAYDPATGTRKSWTIPRVAGVESYGTLSDRPEVADLEGEIHVIPYPDNIMYVLNPKTSVWTRRDFPPEPDFLPIQTVNGKMYVVSMDPAFTKDVSHSLVHEYDPVGHSWSRLAPIPLPAGEGWNSQALVKVGDFLYALGGYRSGSVLGDFAKKIPDGRVMRFDPGTNSWAAGKSAPWAGRWDVSQVSGRSIYVSSYAAGFFRYDVDADEWHSLPGFPHYWDEAAFTAFKGRLYLMGGDAGFIRDNVWVFDTATERWTGDFPMNSPKRKAGSAIQGNTLYLFGKGDFDGESMTLP